MSASGVVTAAILLVGSAVGSQPAAAADGVAVRVVTVLATNTGRAVFDPRLQRLQPQLAGLEFSSYRLLRRQKRYVLWGRPARFSLPGRAELKVRPKTRESAGIALNLRLRGQRRRRLVDTDLCLQDHRVLLMGGPRHRDGVLIVIVAAEAGRPMR